MHQFVPGPLAEYGQIDFGERIGGNHLDQLARLQRRDGPAGAHDRLRTQGAAAVEMMYRIGMFTHG